MGAAHTLDMKLVHHGAHGMVMSLMCTGFGICPILDECTLIMPSSYQRWHVIRLVSSDPR